MYINQLLLRNYLPYAKSTIVARAIPAIDGLKPVQRRILFIMKKLKLTNGAKAKSQRINGQTMVLHPHGDGSIYEALVIMSSGYDGLNVPYIRSKGSFGKKFSRDLKYSAPRYTEAGLADIAGELFDGIDENAVDFRDNFDSTEVEPVLLPVKFPTILINSNAGIAVGTSSSIPTFSLVNVCKATQGIITGDIKTPEQLSEALGALEFTTGGTIRASKNDMIKLCKTGSGSFTIDGHADLYSSKIVIDQIPYSTTAEEIMESIDEHMKNGEFRGIKEVKDEIGLEGLKLVIDLKNGYNSREMLQQLYRLTPLRSKIAFRTRVIIDNRAQELNLMQLLDSWIAFRENSIQRVYQFRFDKLNKQEHLLSTWELIQNSIAQVVATISQNTEAKAKEILMSTYKLDDIQSEYILDMKIRSITTDKAQKSLAQLVDVRANMKSAEVIINSVVERKKVIVSELSDIVKKYGKPCLTTIAPELTVEEEKAPEVKISEENVIVALTKNGFVKRLVTLNDMSQQYKTNDDYEVYRWSIKNNQHMLVYDTQGTVHKILVDDIDSSRGVAKDKLYIKAGLANASDVVWADACGDYTGSFSIVYGNGRGTRVRYCDAIGERKQYKNMFPAVTAGDYFVTTASKFFIITQRLKAAYADVPPAEGGRERLAFKVATISSGDKIIRIQPVEKVPCMDIIDIGRYTCGYTVSIKDDQLWDESDTFLQNILVRKENAIEEKRIQKEEAKKAKEAKEEQ